MSFLHRHGALSSSRLRDTFGGYASVRASQGAWFQSLIQHIINRDLPAVHPGRDVPSKSVTVVPKAVGGEVQPDEPHRDHSDDSEDDLES